MQAGVPACSGSTDLGKAPGAWRGPVTRHDMPKKSWQLWREPSEKAWTKEQNVQSKLYRICSLDTMNAVSHRSIESMGAAGRAMRAGWVA